MFKKIAILLVLIAVSSRAQSEGVYVGGGLNYSKINDANDSGFSLEGVSGMSLGKALRGELAISFQREDIGIQEVKIWEFFGNIYYDFQLESKVTPYVLAGLGYGSAVTGDLFGSSSRDGGLLGQLGAGLALPLSKQVLLDLKYRYQISQKYNLPYTYSFELAAHQFGVGIRYMF